MNKFKLDLKWWNDLEAQQKLTVWLTYTILVLGGVIGSLFWLFIGAKNETTLKVEEMRVSKNKELIQKDIQIATEKARGDACYESQIVSFKQQNERFENLFLNYLELKNKVNENIND